MKAFTFSTVPDLVVECGAAARLGDLLAARYPVGRAMLVTDAFLLRTGVMAPALANLEQRGWIVEVFDAVEADPRDVVVEAAAARARSFGAQVVVGFGGGSSMDVAKLVSVLAGSQQALEKMFGIGNVQGERQLGLVQVPTTAGTGSEVTPIAIVTTGPTKSGIVARQLYADMAVLDASLTIGLPAAITAATGIDAIVHAIEAFTSKRLKNLLSDQAALLALRLLSQNLPSVCTRGDDLAARESMLLGSMLAGQAFANAPVAAVHALAYPLGGRCHLPHGLSNALVLVHVLRFNAEAAPEEYARLAEALDVAGTGSVRERAAKFLDWLGELVSGAGLSLRLRDHGIPESLLPTLASDAMQQTRLLVNNPRPLAEGDALRIYESAY